ncbi:MAG: hypothetical protein EAZ95_04690 [Bacteroidetes bacterium]|nr:MAG: hypothetical protein EAZ95_04690 [Bacteroidota bacterium]
MENFETRLQKRLIPIRAKIQALINEAKATNEAIDEFAVEVKQFCESQQEAKSEKAKQEQNQIQTQSFDFEAFAQTLPALQGKLNYVKEELEDHPDKGNEEIQKLLKEIEKLQKGAEEVEKATEEKDEKKLKKSTIWQRIGNFGKSLIGLRKYIDGKDVDKLGKDLQTVSNLVNAVGIDTGFDYQNYGAE